MPTRDTTDHSIEIISQIAHFVRFKRSWVTPYVPTYHVTRNFVLNRGTNGGAGAAFVFWLSPDKVDSTGAFYGTQSVPWGQITATIVVQIIKR